MINRRIYKNQGFTLIELLIVIAIVGILAGVVLVSMSSARTKAIKAKSMIQLKSINTSIQAYYALYGKYPQANVWTVYGYCSAWSGMVSVSDWIPDLTIGGIISTPLPVDPRQAGIVGCWEASHAQEYIYMTGNSNEYKLISYGPESMDVPQSLIDPRRPTVAWGYWSPGGSGL
jgi:prepilin-type N-terminal cleavage/methylation domain-containing protein